MQITTTDVSTNTYKGFTSLWITVTVGKKAWNVSLSLNPQGERREVTATQDNSSHRTWMGAGRRGADFATVRGFYKSSAAHTAIDTAEEILTGAAAAL
jgi:hypothetical protein